MNLDNLKIEDFESFKDIINKISDCFDQYSKKNEYIIKCCCHKLTDFIFKPDNYYYAYKFWYELAQIQLDPNKLRIDPMKNNRADANLESYPRGMFLDIWDYYEAKYDEAQKNDEYQKNLIGIDHEIIRSFVNELFDTTVVSDVIVKAGGGLKDQKYWMNEVIRIIKMDEEGNIGNINGIKYYIYSLLDLSVTFFQHTKKYYKDKQLDRTVNISYIEQGKNYFYEQLKEFFKAQQLKQNKLLNLSNLLNNFKKGEIKDEEEIFVLILVYLYSIKTINFETLVKIRTIFNNEQDLLRYWAANNAFFYSFIKRVFQISFLEKVDSSKIDENEYLQGNGFDNTLILIGTKNVGKTCFLCCSEYLKYVKITDTFPINNNNTEDASNNNIGTENDKNISNTKTWIEEIKDKWKNNFEWEGTFEFRAKAKTARSEKLCKFELYDIPGEALINDATNNLHTNILNWHIIQSNPVSILIMIEPDTDNEEITNYYKKTIDVIIKQKSEDVNYKNVPIYFIINKYDEFLKGESDQVEILSDFIKKNSMINFRNYISANENLNNYNLAKEKIYSTQIISQNPAYQKRLLSDLDKFHNLLEYLLKKGYTNINIAYTMSLYYESEEYLPIKSIWNHLQNYLIQATKKYRINYIQEKFINYLNKEFSEINTIIKIYNSSNNAEFLHSLDKSQEDFLQILISKFKDKWKNFFDERIFLYFRPSIGALNNNMEMLLKEIKLDICDYYNDVANKLKKEKETLLELFKILCQELGIPENANNFYESRCNKDLSKVYKNGLFNNDPFHFERKILESIWEDENINRSRDSLDNYLKDNNYCTSCKIKTEKINFENYRFLFELYNDKGDLDYKKLINLDKQELKEFCEYTAYFDYRSNFIIKLDCLNYENRLRIFFENDTYKSEWLKKEDIKNQFNKLKETLIELILDIANKYDAIILAIKQCGDNKIIMKLKIIEAIFEEINFNKKYFNKGENEVSYRLWTDKDNSKKVDELIKTTKFNIRKLIRSIVTRLFFKIKSKGEIFDYLDEVFEKSEHIYIKGKLIENEKNLINRKDSRKKVIITLLLLLELFRDHSANTEQFTKRNIPSLDSFRKLPDIIIHSNNSPLIQYINNIKDILLTERQMYYTASGQNIEEDINTDLNRTGLGTTTIVLAELDTLKKEFCEYLQKICLFLQNDNEY